MTSTLITEEQLKHTQVRKKEIKSEKKKPELIEKRLQKEKPRKSKITKKKTKVVVARGKRKESIARATIRDGKGNIRINCIALDAFGNKYMRHLVKQPLSFLGPEATTIDISVTVVGGGVMGQVQAARIAIAKALVQYFDGMGLKEKFVDFDRALLVEDVRRVEPKKFKGPKARARYQKSYR